MIIIILPILSVAVLHCGFAITGDGGMFMEKTTFAAVDFCMNFVFDEFRVFAIFALIFHHDPYFSVIYYGKIMEEKKLCKIGRAHV